MTTPAPKPSAWAREQLGEIVACGYAVEVLAVTEQGTALVLMDDATLLFIAPAADTPRSELSRQVFVMCERAEQSFRRFMHSHLLKNLIAYLPLRSKLAVKLDQVGDTRLLQRFQLFRGRGKSADVLRNQGDGSLRFFDLCLQCQQTLTGSVLCRNGFIEIDELVEIAQQGERVVLRVVTDPCRLSLSEAVDIECPRAVPVVISVLDLAVLAADEAMALSRLILPEQVNLVGPHF